MKKDIIIIGGGIVGLMSAYELVKAKREVTIIDENDITNGASFGNAGLLSSFSKNPLSAPGVLLDTMKLMIKGESPVNLHPSLDYRLYYWLYSFAISANKKRLRKTLALFERYGQIALDSYANMTEEDQMEFYFRRDGLLMIYTEEKSYEAKIKVCQDKEKFTILNKEETKKYMPCVNDKIIGSVLLKQNGHLDPGLLMQELKSYLKNKGVEFIHNQRIKSLEFSNNKVSRIHSNDTSYEANTFILSTGADDHLNAQAKSTYLMTKAKGYSLTFEMKEEFRPKTCTMFADLFIAMTPRKDTVRITSKLELGSNNPDIVKKQIESIKHNLSLYTQDFEMKNCIEWTGFRPLTPDDMPILGFDEKYSNLVHATGLGWLGITFGPAIGKIISELIVEHKENRKSSDILLFSQFYQV